MFRNKADDAPEANNTKNGQLKLTGEQEAIIRSKGNIKINAVAGSGKTTTIIEYARTRPAGSKILYLAFNRAVKLEAEKKFAAQGLSNVKVETAHSLAYKRIVFQNEYTVRSQGYKTHEIVDMLQLKGNSEKHTEYIIANHILKFAAYFCNSDKQKVQDLDYRQTITDDTATDFVQSHYAIIEHGTRLLLSRMYRGTIEITHDFYLKKFQLQNPVLPYDYILFDEGQDASAAMLDIFLKQKATKVIVGDTHQQIYGWRYAINSLEKANFKSFHLSTSFRFHQDIADLAVTILDWKRFFQEQPSVIMKGKGKPAEKKVKAIIARTNLGLLLKAIEYITTHKQVKHIYFEGNINSYTYADEGTSLYDVLSLHNFNHGSIRDKLVGSMSNLDELEEYIEKTEDVQLSMMVDLVKEYGNAIPGLIKTLKEKHTGDEEKAKAEVIFSTVHRCKGMEYDTIELVNDFVTEAKLERLTKENKQPQDHNQAKWYEEINLLYVAITRTKGSIRIPETLLPAGFDSSPFILSQEVKKETETQGTNSFARTSHTGSKQNQESNKHIQVRERLKEEPKPWTAGEDRFLKQLFEDGVHIMEIAKRLNRKTSIVLSRLKKLGLLNTNKF
ncbi:DNA helicase [Flavisolibacter tropicus]|uniref:DNA helicase n=1 Tax=Flavisolibacter tropicus TaxID=1492898 RepID=A0A172U2E9_9BACT|nr:DNA helicase [Flavisolibacter tropicus]